MMNSGPLPRAYPTIGSQGDLNGSKLPAACLDLDAAGGMVGGLGGFGEAQKVLDSMIRSSRRWVVPVGCRSE